MTEISIVSCGECQAPMLLRESRFGKFYGCTRFPECRGTHGAHPDGRPLGVPANAETKEARVIRRFDGARTLFYVDPPYVRSTRSDRWARNGYRHELDDDGHRALARLLRRIKGMAVVSGYASELYDVLYRGWVKRSFAGKSFRGEPRVEVLWLSPKAERATKQLELPTMRGGGSRMRDNA